MKRSCHIEALTVCIGHGDFLHETAKWNTQHFDEWFVATSPDDLETREVCRKFNLTCVLTEDHKKGGKFNKGRLIDRLLHLTSQDSWRLHIDADIAAPHGFRDLIQSAGIPKDGIYGADRIDIHGWIAWQKFLSTGFMMNSLDYGCRVNLPPGFTIGHRWAHPVYGWLPIGFFQLWHSESDEWRGIKIRNYSHRHGTACRTDVQFPLLWDREKRQLIPELLVAHLMSEKAKNGVNWDGDRKTMRFGPEWRGCNKSKMES